ncbi:MAG: hypothetical protein OHK0029_17110 [Armatimonadaceae bacterium]
MAVLAIGTCLMELLFDSAPRRGKRPDDTAVPPPRRPIVRVVTLEGRLLRGTPRRVVRTLGDEMRIPLPWYLSHHDAEQLLDRWEREGSVLVMGDWEG